MTFSRRLAASATMLLFSLSASAGYAQAVELVHPRGVVELFTSQGCSSCPSADKVLRELSASADTLALAWHVGYWDNLGWKDTFGSRENTERQRSYAHTLRQSYIYTPQAVVNGRVHLVGSKGDELKAKLAEFAGTGNGLTVPVGAKISDGMLQVSVPVNEMSRDATLWMVYFRPSAEVEIERGENSGRKLAYSNIVRSVEMIGTVKDHDLNTEYKLSDLARHDGGGCALILQKSGADGSPAAIIGALILRDLQV